MVVRIELLEVSCVLGVPILEAKVKERIYPDFGAGSVSRGGSGKSQRKAFSGHVGASVHEHEDVFVVVH